MSRVLRTAFGVFLLVCGVQAYAIDVTVSDAWVRQSLPGENTTSAFVTIQVNEDASLVGAECDDAGAVSLGQVTRHPSGFVTNHVVDQIPLEKNKKNVLSRGGYHIMLMNLKPSRLSPRENLQIRLKIRTDDGETTVHSVSAPVRGLVVR